MDPIGFIEAPSLCIPSPSGPSTSGTSSMVALRTFASLRMVLGKRWAMGGSRCFGLNIGGWRWIWNWCRNLFDWEQHLLLEMEQILAGFQPVPSSDDTWVWTAGSSGLYMVQSAYSFMRNLHCRPSVT
ncbi:hypothetical protein Ancab_028395 [Ancistrocladus abbreviatus]